MVEIPYELIEAAIRGDQLASRKLVELLHRPILATMHRFLGKRFQNEVEDIAQDIFLKVFRALDRFDPDRGVKFTTWVFTFVRNHCFDVLKKKRIPTLSIHGESEAEDGRDWDVADEASKNPEDHSLETELGTAIENALQTLSAGQRMTFVLREYEQLEVRAIAKIMDCSEGTVKSRLHRAKDALRQRLEPYMRDP